MYLKFALVGGPLKTASNPQVPLPKTFVGECRKSPGLRTAYAKLKSVGVCRHSVLSWREQGWDPNLLEMGSLFKD